MLKKDKEKVLDEVWTEERIHSFLNLTPPAGVNADFHALNTAYKSMRADDFAIFVEFFGQAKRDFQAKNPEGQTTLDIIQQHRKGGEYAELIQKAL